jgi:hypothetical protein
MRDFALPPTHQQLRVAPVFRSQAIEPEDAPSEDLFSDEEEAAFYGGGMLNAFQSRGKKVPTPRPAPPQVTIPGVRGGPSLTVKRRDISFYLKFASNDADWPSNVPPVVAPLKDPSTSGAKPAYKEQVVMLLKHMRPNIQETTITNIYDTAKAHNRDWVWCILHGCEGHHHTHRCPCLLKAFPDRSEAYQREKRQFQRGAVQRLQYADGAASGEEDY